MRPLSLLLIVLPSLLVCSFLLVCTLSCQAQVTIFNVPSADLTPKGDIWVETEGQFRPYPPGQTFFGTQYSSLGIGKNTEINLTAINTDAPYNRNVGVSIGFKSVIPVLPRRFPNREFKLIVGEMVPISLVGQGVGNWAYVEGSGRIPWLKTRLTGGLSAGSRQVFGRDIVCFAGGVEQPVGKNLTVQMDWFSGKNNSLGYVIPGFAYTLPRRWFFYAGYAIPNSPTNGPSGFIIELAKLYTPKW